MTRITSFFPIKSTPKNDTVNKEKKGDKNNNGDESSSSKRKHGNNDDHNNEKKLHSNKVIKTDESSTVSSLSSSSKKDKKVSAEVEELLSLLDEPDFSIDDDNNTKKTWHAVMTKCLQSPFNAKLVKFVSNERQKKTVYPPVQDTFSALNYTPLDQVKVVIVGQDPYHQPGQAHGLSFSVRKGIKIPPSLRNIYKELVNDQNIPKFTTIPQHGYLERWARQGVLMLNAVLTVRKDEANSHQKKGWEAITDEIIRAVDRQAKSNGNGVVFLLWGKPASKKAMTILGGTASSRHTIICTSHPSPLGASKTNSPFLGSKCFSQANEALKKFGHDEIDWRVDGDL